MKNVEITFRCKRFIIPNNVIYKTGITCLWVLVYHYIGSLLLLQQLRHEMEQLEAWINIREPVMKEKNVGENIQAVEELLRRQDDFEKTVDAQSEKFNSICRRTQVT